MYLYIYLSIYLSIYIHIYAHNTHMCACLCVYIHIYTNPDIAICFKLFGWKLLKVDVRGLRA